MRKPCAATRVCNGRSNAYEKNEPVLVSAAPRGATFEWKQISEVPFLIPRVRAKRAQHIFLRNPGAAAAGKAISGDIWFDDLAISNDTNPR